MNELIDMERFCEAIKSNLDIKNINTIMDLGSMDGTDSLYLKSQFPNSKVYSIEGLPQNYDIYLKNLKEIIPINTIISNYNGNINYYVKNINGIHGILDRGQEYGSTILNLPCITLDKLCEDLNISHIDILKIDVEGATFEILDGAKNILSMVKMLHIETEDYPFFSGQKLHNEVINFLLSKKFKIIEMKRVEILPGKFQYDTILKGDS